MFNLTPIVKNLLLINVLMFAIPELILPNHNLFVEFFGLRYILSQEFSLSQLVTYALVHASWGHLLSNMFGLFIFGPILESTLGPKKFLIFYAVTAIGAGLIYSGIHYMEVKPFQDLAEAFLQRPSPDAFVQVLSDYSRGAYEANLDFIDTYARNPNDEGLKNEAIRSITDLLSARLNGPMVGASGAIFGILMGCGFLYPNLQMMLIFPPIPIRMKYLVGFYGISALYSAIEKVPGDNVAHFAHLGGMIVAYLLLRYWKTTSNYYS
jgi:membrane associated rhomboid family serine protease